MKLTSPLETMIETVRKTPNVTVLQHELYPKRVLPSSFFGQYPFLHDYQAETLYLNDNRFVWQLTDGGQGLSGGEFHFPEIEQSLALNGDYCEQFVADVPNVVPDYVLLVDEHPYAGDGHLVYMVVREGERLHEIWHRDDNGLWSSLNMNIRTYLHRTAEFWSLYNWHLFFRSTPPLSAATKSYLKQEQKRVGAAFGTHPFVDLKH